MKRKIFISINLLAKTKKSLCRATEEWQDLPVKWVKEPNLHITLEFLGHVVDDFIPEICANVCEAVVNTEIFDLEFEKICLGPSEAEPRMIWLAGNANEELKNLREKIEKALDIFSTSKKSFRPHITLGKIRQHKWQALAELPIINKNFPLTITAESVDIMASEFEGDGMEYTIIQSCPLK
ncbi:MAG: RNA 2',3'-cyclic phosphodiesterase [Parcubacteria group bacterium]|jgi:2'-5' RNA ligase